MPKVRRIGRCRSYDAEVTPVLSFSQEALWFLCQLEPGSPFYNLSRAYRLRGRLVRPALERAFLDLLEQHQVLRSRILDRDGRPEPVVDPVPPEWPVELLDLTGLPAARQRDRLAELTRELDQRPFDLARDRLLRARLVRLDQEEHLLQVTFHHILLDRWSVDQLFGPQLAARYTAHAAGGAQPLPTPAQQYWDFAAWQRERLTDDRSEELAGYWHQSLAGAPTVLEVPGDRPRPAEPSLRGALYDLALPADLLTGARKVSRAARSTLFMTLLTAVATVLAEAGSTDQLVLGTPVMSGGRFVFPEPVGMFVNTLPIRVDLRGAPSVLTALRRVRTAVLGATAHSELPFERIVAGLDLERDPGRAPLFQVAFQFEDQPPGAGFGADGVFAETVPVEEGSIRFDLEFYLWLTPEGGIGGRIGYATDLYEESTVARLAGRLREVLTAMVEAADPAVEPLPLVTPGTDRGEPAATPPSPFPSPSPSPSAVAEAPTSEAEHLVLRIWREVLEGAEPGLDDNFFHLGGGSLRATRVAARLRRELGTEVELRLLFRNPTARALAAALPAPASAPDQPISLVRPARPPLSFAQERLWFLDQLVPGSTAYVIDTGFWLADEPDLAALDHALQQLVSRHESLRTSFPADETGRPWQAVAPAAAPRVSVVPVPVAAGESAREAVVRAARQRMAGGFDLASGPLLRVTLFRTPVDGCALVLNVHHAVCDGVSLTVLARELAAFHTAHTTGVPVGLPPLPVQYADYAGWQRSRPASHQEPRLAYWREQLADLSPLELPTDRPRPAAQSLRGGRQEFALDPALTRALSELSGGDDAAAATPYLTLLAAYAALLGRYCEQDDICVAIPLDNRERPELEGLVGFFVDTVPLRVDLGGDPSFRQLLGRVREQFLAAHQHRGVPFERLVAEVEAAPDPSRNPLAQVSLGFHDAPAPTLELGGRSAEPFSLSDPTTRFDLELHTWLSDGRLGGFLSYAADLFDAGSGDRLLRHLRTLLTAAVADPDRPLSELELLDAAERHELLVLRNDTAVDLGPPRSLHQLVEEQAARTPEATAVVCGAAAVSYAELDQRAERLAAQLGAAGAGPQRLVAVCLEQSVELVVSLLAVLKSGAAFLALSPEDPPERLRELLAAADPLALLTSRRVRAALPDGLRLPVVLADAATALAPAASRVATDPERLAYTVYTSGSTGRPQGVRITHRAIVDRIRWSQRELPLAGDDAMLQKSPVTFDIFTWECFWPLAVGARLVLAEPGDHRDPTRLARLIEERRITTAIFVPAVLRLLLQEPGIERAGASLRRVVSGGEALDPELRDRFHQLLDAELYNMYGPAEATVMATCWRSPPGVRLSVVPIGRPVANTEVYVLDRRQRPVPVGVPGELYLGGVGIARGYLGQPELTAHRFVPDPFGADPDRRLFRTGDRVRHRPDGTLEFLGRRDGQLKLRGVRIAAAEIEAVLTAHPRVRSAAVVLREDTPGQPRLVAYLVLAGESGVEQVRAELTAALRGRLPMPAVPSVLVTLDELPLSRNGKLDRRRLPAPPSVVRARPAAPRDGTERALAQLVAAVLSVPEVGVRDDFFALGGQSVLAAQLMTRVERAFGYRPALAAFFQQPTVEWLATAVRGGTPVTDSCLVRLRPGGDGRVPLFLFAPAGGGVQCYQELVRALPAGPAVYGLRTPGLDPGSEPEPDLAALVTRQAAAVRGVAPTGPYRLAGWSFGGVVAFGVAAELARAGLEIRSLLLIDSYPAPGSTSARQRAVRFVAAFAREYGLSVPSDPIDLSEQPPLEWITSRLRAGGLAPDQVDDAQLARYWRVYAANVQAGEEPWPTSLTGYPGAVSLIRPRRPGLPSAGAANGWDRVVSGQLRVHQVGEDHHTVLGARHAAEVAALLTE